MSMGPDRQFRLGPHEEANCSHSQYDACPLALGPGGASAKVEWSGNDGRWERGDWLGRWWWWCMTLDGSHAMDAIVVVEELIVTG